MKPLILVTGRTSYIASQSYVALLNAGFDILICDNLSNSYQAVIDHIATITAKKGYFFEGDIRDEARLAAITQDAGCDVVIHFAGLKSLAREFLSYWSHL